MDTGLALLVGGGILVWFGFSMQRKAKLRLGRMAVEAQEQHNIDLGTLGPIAAMMLVGKLTAEQADREVNLSAVMRPSLRALWGSMTVADREDLGRNMILAYADPAFAGKQAKLVEELKSADPVLWQRAERAVQARDKVHQAEQQRGPLDPFERDMIQLSVIDPEGYQELMIKLKEKAAGGQE